MFTEVFQFEEWGYSYDKETGNYLLYSSELQKFVILKDRDAEIFQEHIELLTNEPDHIINIKIARTINNYMSFITKQYPIPQFIF